MYNESLSWVTLNGRNPATTWDEDDYPSRTWEFHWLPGAVPTTCRREEAPNFRVKTSTCMDQSWVNQWPRAGHEMFTRSLEGKQMNGGSGTLQGMDCGLFQNWNSQAQMSSPSCQQNDYRLPQYHEDFMQLRQMEASDFLKSNKNADVRDPIQPDAHGAHEAWSSTMHQKMQECQEQLAQNRKEEEGVFGAQNWQFGHPFLNSFSNILGSTISFFMGNCLEESIKPTLTPPPVAKEMAEAEMANARQLWKICRVRSKSYPPGNQDIPFHLALLSRWFSLCLLVGYVIVPWRVLCSLDVFVWNLKWSCEKVFTGRACSSTRHRWRKHWHFYRTVMSHVHSCYSYYSCYLGIDSDAIAAAMDAVYMASPGWSGVWDAGEGATEASHFRTIQGMFARLEKKHEFLKGTQATEDWSKCRASAFCKGLWTCPFHSFSLFCNFGNLRHLCYMIWIWFMTTTQIYANSTARWIVSVEFNTVGSACRRRALGTRS